MTRVVIHNHLTRDAEGPRAGSRGKGSSSYAPSGVEFTQMANDRWYVFVNKRDTGGDFATLKAAKSWASSEEGKRKIAAMGKT